jgi:hypothetical protein
LRAQIKKSVPGRPTPQQRRVVDHIESRGHQVVRLTVRDDGKLKLLWTSDLLRVHELIGPRGHRHAYLDDPDSLSDVRVLASLVRDRSGAVRDA